MIQNDGRDDAVIMNEKKKQMLILIHESSRIRESRRWSVWWMFFQTRLGGMSKLALSQGEKGKLKMSAHLIDIRPIFVKTKEGKLHDVKHPILLSRLPEYVAASRHTEIMSTPKWKKVKFDLGWMEHLAAFGYGSTAIHVSPGEAHDLRSAPSLTKGFAYTLGLQLLYLHPDFLLAGPIHYASANLLHILAKLVQRGTVFLPGTQYTLQFEHISLSLSFREPTDIELEDHVGQLRHLHWTVDVCDDVISSGPGSPPRLLGLTRVAVLVCDTNLFLDQDRKTAWDLWHAMGSPQFIDKNKNRCVLPCCSNKKGRRVSTRPSGSECSGCGSDRGKLLMCARCRLVKYCSRACQVKAWPQHKKACRRASTQDAWSYVYIARVVVSSIYILKGNTETCWGHIVQLQFRW
jgi:hypothetical protein